MGWVRMHMPPPRSTAVTHTSLTMHTLVHLRPAGTHHSKFAILWYRGGVRVVITTANFIQVG